MGDVFRLLSGEIIDCRTVHWEILDSNGAWIDGGEIRGSSAQVK